MEEIADITDNMDMMVTEPFQDLYQRLSPSGHDEEEGERMMADAPQAKLTRQEAARRAYERRPMIMVQNKEDHSLLSVGRDGMPVLSRVRNTRSSEYFTVSLLGLPG